MFAAKQQLQGALGGGEEGAQNETPKTDKMRQEIEEKRAARTDDYATRKAERRANKSKVAQMWAENKAKQAKQNKS